MPADVSIQERWTGDLIGALRFAGRNALVLRRTWWVPASGSLEPLFYLAWVFVWLGPRTGGSPVGATTPVDYTTFVATALVAVSVMNGAVYESSLNVYYRLRYAGTYRALVSTPLTVRAIAAGEIVTAGARGMLYGLIARLVMGLLGIGGSPAGALLTLVGCAIAAFAFAAFGLLAAMYLRSWDDAEYVSLALLPMFLFSSTFFPLANLPAWAQILVEITPLIHVVGPIRASIVLNQWDLGTALDLTYLTILGAVALFLATRRLRRELLT